MPGRPMLTIGPGLMLHVWNDGAELATARLEHFAADQFRTATLEESLSSSGPPDPSTGRPREILMRAKSKEVLLWL